LRWGPMNIAFFFFFFAWDGLEPWAFLSQLFT
jgi:hypothetical protein